MRRGPRWLLRLVLGESASLRRAGLPGMPAPSRLWYWLSGGGAWLVFHGLVRLDQAGREHRPRDGGWMLVSNHLSSADPAMVAAAIYPRWPKYMAKLELFQKPFTGTLFALSGAFPVRRFESDLAALRDAEAHLARGEILGMFPEGHRSETGALIEAYPGTAMIALRTNARIVPVAITGSERLRGGWRMLLRRPRVRMVFGQPFRLEHTGRVDRQAVEAATTRIMREIAALLPAEYRGVYRVRFPDLPEAPSIPPAGGSRAQG